jgi:hypothetical protein
MDAALVFNSITPAKFDAICARAQEKTGVAISGLQGTAGRDTPFGHVEIEWSYNPETELLSLQCLKRPPFTEGRVENELRQLVEES